METLMIVWVLFLFSFKILESVRPSTKRETPKLWWLIFLFINLISYTAFSIFEHTLILIQPNKIPSTFEILTFYLIYSFINYWIHRLKHHPKIWRLHELHHAPNFMQVEISLFRHPIETIFNLIYLFLLSLLFEASFILCLSALLIEGCLEIYHHSNTSTPSWLRRIRYIIQVPEMHLLHHKHGLHHYNYSPIAFWDLIFKTHKVPENWEFDEKLGLNSWCNIKPLLLWTKNK